MKIIKWVISRAKWEYTKVKHFVIGLRARKYYKTTIFDYDPSFFKGKSIAIVGGADSVFSEKKGAYIDSFDVVIRINRGINVSIGNEEYLGTRTDVLFHGLNEGDFGAGKIEVDKWKSKGVQNIVFPLIGKDFKYMVDNFCLKNKSKLPLMRITKEMYNEIIQTLKGYNATTGFATIYLISKINYKKLYVTGFTFLRTPHCKGYNEYSYNELKAKVEKVGFHKIDFEYEWFKEFYYANLHKVEIDEGMKLIF
ncbi:glycosyltransferase family 29 protein [Capnocytophaga cynodegmi]|uniref:Uncharacterized protein n=1 Tax=Capnocytophaga cynodegmi TaxID=28189 RepID=A0A0B7HA05_9FLAO|nr:glycosyltransferase family 29 protein [Capnocytophaga cynodegmi]CEN34767.1 conserved hypothetical protein [Capnocytophaga cynodegmi]